AHALSSGHSDIRAGCAGSSLASSTSDCRKNRHRVAVLHCRLEATHEPDVLVVDVDVHEPAQAFLVHDPVAKAGVPGVEVDENVGQGATVTGDGLFSPGVGAQDGRDADLDGHAGNLLKKGVQVGVTM